ncbi:MAG: hypothetical protein ACKOFH_02685 [Chthoniobacterales bacterium]
MKKLLPLVFVPLLLAGCISEDEFANIVNPYNRPGQYGGLPANQRPMTPYQSQSFYQPAYRDGYRQGYNAGFYDGSRGMPYRANSNYRGPAYSVPFSDGYYKGYAEGFNEGRRGIVYGCSL